MQVPAETPDKTGSNVEIGPPPYFHQSDCNICKKQDGVKLVQSCWTIQLQAATSSRKSTFWSSTLRFKGAVPEP